MATPALDGNDFAQALYGAVAEQLSAAVPVGDGEIRDDAEPYGDEPAVPAASGLDLIRAEMSLRLETLIRNEAVVRWRDNPDAQNRMRNQRDDYLFHLQRERGITLTLEQMDTLIESCLSIARNRPDDV